VHWWVCESGDERASPRTDLSDARPMHNGCSLGARAGGRAVDRRGVAFEGGESGLGVAGGSGYVCERGGGYWVGWGGGRDGGLGACSCELPAHAARSPLSPS